MKRSTLLLFLAIFLFGYSLQSQEQELQFQKGKTSDKIHFQFINNLIIIPLTINGVELSFILDTGVTKPILFNHISNLNILNVNKQATFFLKGLGDGEVVQAVKSIKNTLQIGHALNTNQTIYAIRDANIDYLPKLGVPVHGIIGHDVFKDFIVKINYRSKHIKLISHKKYNARICRKCEKLPLQFHNLKPYINAEVLMRDKLIPVKMLLDTGASDALWLFEDAASEIVSNSNYFNDFLGHGLSGSLYGKRSKINALHIESFKLKNTLVAYPFGESIELLKKIKDRNGTIGAEVLKRFHLTFNYKDSYVILKKNRNFKKPFRYNKSGIEIEQRGIRIVKDYYYTLNDGRLMFSKDVTQHITNQEKANYRFRTAPAFKIVKLRPNSPAKLSGLQLGDVILEINGKDLKNYSLQEAVEQFKGRDGKKIRVLIERQNSKVFEFTFNLKDLLNQKQP